MLPTQTFWLTKDLTCGWLSIEFHLMGWALSFHSIQKHHSTPQLLSNEQGAELLVGQLSLPYAGVSLVLDGFELEEFSEYSLLRKIRAYALQNEPFVHIDGDAFLFAPLPQTLLTASLFAQNYEYNHTYYETIYGSIKQYFRYIPDWIHPNHKGYIAAANTGLVGGTDTAFYKNLQNEITYFLEQNRAFLHLATPNIDFSIFLEQVFFQSLADQKDKKIQYLLDYEVDERLNYGLDRFKDLPTSCSYIHLMSYKHNPTACEQMAQRLWIEAPELYERCRVVARQLEATNHVVSIPIELSASYRSSLLSPNSPPDVMNDIFDFEQQKKEFTTSLPSEAILWQLWQDHSVVINTKLSLPKSQLLQQYIGHSKLSKRIVSEWNWAEANEFLGQDKKPDYVANTTIDSTYFEVALYVYPHLLVIKEHLLDVINILILDTFEQPKSFEEGLETLWKEVFAYQPEAIEIEMKESIKSRISFFLYQGVLTFK